MDQDAWETVREAFRRALAPEVWALLREYERAHPTWGSLHIVLEDGNIEDEHVEFCERWARDHGDEMGVTLARMISELTDLQRAMLCDSL